MSLPPNINQKTIFKQCRELIKQKKQDEALPLLLKLINDNTLDASSILKAGRIISKMTFTESINVAVFGQCTSIWLAQSLQALAAANNQFLKIKNESYDNVVQGLLNLGENTDIVILLPWNQRLFAQNSLSTNEKIIEEVNFWSKAWQLIKKNSNARIIQIGYDWIDSGSTGQFLSGEDGGDVYLIRTINQQLRKNLPDLSYFIDLEQISGIFGRRQFYDSRSYFWTKQPLSESGVIFLSQYLSAGIQSLLVGPKKVLVIDLDNTLWGGIVGEVGADGILLGDNPAGEAFRSFQFLLKQLSSKGCLLAVCSKNNYEDAREPFEKNTDMILSLNDISAFKASWEPKSEAIKKIASELNLGLDSFVFFDDSIVEREEVRHLLPEVKVANVPTDPADYREALLKGLWFEYIQTTSEDKQRVKLYQDEAKRSNSQITFSSLDEYLASLCMTANVQNINELDFERVIQLIAKTNQFNLTSRRHSREKVLGFMSQDRSIGISLRLTDKFGDYGLVSIILAIPEPENSKEILVIDSWLMSCRAIGRTAEYFLFNALLEKARDLGYKKIYGEYIPTKKNILVKDLFQKFGFKIFKKSNNNNKWYELDLSSSSNVNTFLEPLKEND